MIPTRVHGVLDYLVGIILIAAPWIFGFADTQAAMWVPIILGAGAILYSLITDYELGLVRVLPMRVHLIIDMIGGLFLAASPWLFDFAEVVWVPHLAVGLFMLLSGAMTSRVPSATRIAATGDHTGHAHDSRTVHR